MITRNAELFNVQNIHELGAANARQLGCSKPDRVVAGDLTLKCLQHLYSAPKNRTNCRKKQQLLLLILHYFYAQNIVSDPIKNKNKTAGQLLVQGVDHLKYSAKAHCIIIRPLVRST